MFFNELADDNHNIMCLVGNGFDQGAIISFLRENVKDKEERGLWSNYSSFF